MPQASLLDFFKSKTPGPFAPTIPTPDTSDIQAEAESGETFNNDELENEDQTSSSEQQNGTSNPAEQMNNKAALVNQRGQPPKTSAPSTSTSPPEVSGLSISGVEIEHLPALRRLTSTLLPVKYPDAFYTGAVEDPIPASFSRVAIVNEKPIGWIRCRLDPFPELTVPPSKTRPIYNQLYIQALCLLGPYRGLGIATFLLEDVVYEPRLSEHDVSTVYAHVWESNENALVWYKRRGFRQVMKIDDYYRKLRPSGAWIVKKDLS